MRLPKGAGQVLGGEELKMFGYLEHLGLSVEVVRRGHLQRAGRNAQASILDRLETD